MSGSGEVHPRSDKNQITCDLDCALNEHIHFTS